VPDARFGRVTLNLKKFDISWQTQHSQIKRLLGVGICYPILLPKKLLRYWFSGLF